MCRSLGELCKFCKEELQPCDPAKARTYVSIITNGSLVTEKWIQVTHMVLPFLLACAMTKPLVQLKTAPSLKHFLGLILRFCGLLCCRMRLNYDGFFSGVRPVR